MIKRLLLICILLLSLASICSSDIILKVPSATVGDGLIGQTAHAGNPVNMYHAEGYWYTQFTTTTAGNVSYGHFWVTTGNSKNICISLLNASTGAVLLSNTMTAADGQWNNLSMGGSYEIQASTNYLLAVYVVDSGSISSVDSGSGSSYYDNGTITCGSTAASLPGSGGGAQLPIVFDNQSGNPS